MPLTTRQGKGAKLTIQEMDENLIYLESLSSGSSGTSGTSGVNGPSGSSGTSGSSGVNGPSGSSGTSGIDGSSGTSGVNGPSGSSGTSGSSGVNGPSGSSGTSGSSGSSGANGAQFTYEIGQYVVSEGGVIMHRWLSTTANGTPTAGTTENYIVVDLTDLSSSAQWASLTVDIPNVESTYDGETNTANLIAAGAASGITAGTAAQLCDVSAAQSQTDWYLPSIDELSRLWHNRWEVAQGLAVGPFSQLSNGIHWSSTERDGSTAMTLNFSSGSVNSSSSKNFTYYVRAVRRFSI